MTKHYLFSWESFPLKTHKYTFAALHDLIAHFIFFTKIFSARMNFEKLNLLLVSKTIWCLFKNKMNQAILSSRWPSSKPENMNRKMNCHSHTMTLKPSILNVWIMICSEFVVHGLVKCIFLQILNHHTRWHDQKIDVFSQVQECRSNK